MCSSDLYAMRESGPWTYAVVNLAHVAGVAAFFGAVLVLDLRLVGLWRRVPLAMVSAVTQPVVVVGLGLAMVYGFVQQTGGAIHFTTAGDQGTTFELSFPLA